MITRLARVAVRRPVRVLAGWAVLVVALAIAGIPVQSRLLPSDLLIPGTQSYHWTQLKAPNYGEPIALVLRGPAAELDRQGPELSRALALRPYTRVQSPWSPGAGAAVRVLRPSPTQAVFALDVRLAPGQNSSTAVPPLERFIDSRIRPPVRAFLSGDSVIGREMNTAGFDALHTGELIAAPLLVIILLLVFRSPVAAAIPLLIAGGTVGSAFGILRILTAVTRLDIMALSLASMMGLALGVDYALLLVSRFREGLEEGLRTRQAATLAANTAGRTTIFAGCVLSALMLTVIVLSPGSLLRSASIGAVASTIFAMTSGVLVCPALLTLLGPRVNKWQVGGRRGRERNLIGRAVGIVGSRPALIGAMVLVALLALASPVLALKTTPFDPRQLPPGNPALRAYQQVRAAGIGPNISIAVRRPGGGAITSRQDLAAISNFEDELRRVPYVTFVTGPGLLEPQSRLIASAPAQIAQTQKQLNAAHTELNRRIDQVSAAQSQLASDKVLLANGLAGAQSLLNQGRAMLAGVNGQLGQLGQLASGLALAAAGAGQLATGAQTLRANAEVLAGALSEIRGRVGAAVPQVQSADKQIRTAQAQLGLLRVQAQATQRALRQASSDLGAATVGNADPAVQRAKLDVAAAQAAGGGLPAELAQAQSQASSAGDQADGAVRQAQILADALTQVSDGAARLADPGLSTLAAGLAQLAGGLQSAHDRVAAAAPQIESLQARANSLLGQGQAQLNAAGAQAFPQIQSAQAQLLDAGNRLVTVRDQLVSKSGPFKPLREVDQALQQSPFVFQEPYAIVAALEGTRPVQRSTAQTVVDSSTGADVGQVVILPNVQTNSPQQDQVVGNVRALASHLAKQTHLSTAVGGSAAELVDYANTMSSRVPIVFAALAVVTYLMLVPILRSVVLPAIAVLLNLLTVAVAMGFVTIFSVDGVIASRAPIGGAGKPDIIAVTAIFSVVFALSIDYYVFLLTRMREEYVRTQSNPQAVTFGIEKTGRIVTGAAAIMIGTFFAFALTSFTIVRELGIGLCTAIVIDATLVRLGLLPAVMRVFGDWTWYIPAWLDERLPVFDIEGAAFEREAEQLGQPPMRGAPGFA